MASNDEQRSATTILTTAAQSIAARLIANETTAKFTKAEISTTNLFNQSVTELQVLTSLDNVQQTADINTVTVINNNTVNVNVAIDQTKAPNNYQMNSVGLFAVDGDGKEVLYSVTVLKDPVYIHQDAMGSALGIDLETVVGQASNVEISVNPAGAVTNEILKAALADYVKADDSTVVHTADMRKPANQVASIDEVNTKQDKIGYTPADDSKVVHDNGNGTIQVNGTQVNPYNKLTDSVGGRNLLIGSTDNIVHYDSVTGYTVWKSYVTQFNVGDTLNISADITSNAGNTVLKVFLLSSTEIQIGYLSYTVSEGKTAHALVSKTIPTGTASILVQIDNGNEIGQKDVCAIGHQFANTGSIATDWTPAPEDKVSVSDMRKPASDVAGLEDVPQAVIHSELASGADLNTVVTSGVYPFKAVSFINFINRATYWGYLVVTSEGQMITQEFHNAGPGMPFYRTQYGYPPSWTPWRRMADDSKVVHLSGANNFDTVPTVNNNPLLLASSLPSDLARTSQQANFTGKLQKSGVDVATVDDVSAKQDKLDYTPANDANTFHRSPDTGAVTESGNFPGLQVKGVDVATAADLKSVEESAWREITNPAFQGSYLFRDNQDGTVSLSGTIYFTKPTQKYKGLDDYSIPLPDGYKATGMSSSGAIMGFINDYSITAEMLSAYFSGNILHLYSSLSEDRSMSISLCSIMKSELAIITSGPVILNVIK
ncbi:hypothetical protein LBR02_00090 [Levilactobacillus brevis]|uniref:pyocin knob domain-containing protein n=1 Tax=Levilactobacillus brevis TaxID=1580 RepID=UPI00116D8E8C|nr:pyocin knob domain-containing protein [Levilactobacillus brevis]GEA97444.1 hypothetical protein LBR02_00090 [Levilactobacillus brevis]